MEFAGVFLFWTLAGLISFAASNDIVSVMTHKVEFKTEASVETVPDTPKDCYEYLYGHLNEIRRHGTTWQGVSDCSNCTCDNGDIRCFIHFCNGPSTGYMTPPSAGKNSSAAVGTSNIHHLVADDDTDAEESSGYSPNDVTNVDDDDAIYDLKEVAADDVTTVEIETFENAKLRLDEIGDDEDAVWPNKVLPEKWKNELSAFETSSAPAAPSTSFRFIDDSGLPKNKEKKDRSENETHDVFKAYFCGKPCKKNCPQGFKTDPVKGCWTCSCNECLNLSSCTDSCPLGYAVDSHGCETCSCLSDSNGDIVFKEEEEESLEVHNDVTTVTVPVVITANAVFEDEEQVTVEAAHSEEVVAAAALPNTEELVTSTSDEPCNNTEPRGCLDGKRKFHVGGRWSRGPCVSCRCVAPGYSECNITQCHALHSCPRTQRYIPSGACCAICKDKISLTLDAVEVEHESRSTSRVTSDQLPSKPEDKVKLNPDDAATVTSIARDDNSHLLLILIPMGVIVSVGILLSTHMWRRYHRDKYDINSYREEEKQKLRPVKTMHDDQLFVKHHV